MIGLLGVAAAVLVVVGIVGFALPGSNDAKEKGDRLEQQLAATRKTTQSAQAQTNAIRDAVDRLGALDVQEAQSANSVIDAFNSATDQPGFEASSYSDPALRAAVDSLGQLIAQEKQVLTELQGAVAQARGAPR